MSAIEAKNLVKKFNSLTAVDDLSFEVKEGEIFGLLGPNGAGKTTTIKMLTTLIPQTSGSAKVFGFDIAKQKGRVRDNIGIVFQEPALDNRLTGAENLDLHARLYGLSRRLRTERMKEVLTLVGLEEKARVLVKNYSGGMKRRLEIARGLMHYPKVLFLDEPTLGLDPQTRRNIWQYIKKLNETEKISIVLTTHYMEEADSLCDRIAIIDFGKIVALDTPKMLKNMLGGDVISIEAFPQETAYDLLKDLPWVKKIKIHEDFIHLMVEQGEQKLPLLIQIDQEQEGITFKTINLRKPTLEDVFLNFTGKTIRDVETQNGNGFKNHPNI
jgi:ABC-2 type transport system ATP-binding protein